MLRRIRVAGFKTFREVEVRPGPLTVLVGANASGKTNLLDAIRLLARCANERTLLHAFEGPRGRPGECFHEDDAGQLAPAMRFEADVDLSPVVVDHVSRQVHALGEGPAGSVVRDDRLRYCLELRLEGEPRRLRVGDECLESLRRDGSPKASRNAFLERESGRLHLRRESGGHPYYHELGLDRTVISEPIYPPHFPHAVAFREELCRWRVHRFEMSGLRQAASALCGETIAGTGGGLPAFLRRLVREAPEELSRVTERLRRLLPFVDGIELRDDDESAVQLAIVEHGRPVSARLASSGTLRLLAVLSALSGGSGTTLVCLEEPEAGVHPRRFAALAEVLREAPSAGGPQVIVTTHSSDFARCFGNEEIRVCERSGWQTRILPFEERVGGLFRDAALEDAMDDRG